MVMLTVLTIVSSTKVLWQDGHHTITTCSTIHEFGFEKFLLGQAIGSQMSLNIVEEVIEVDGLNKGNTQCWPKKKQRLILQISLQQKIGSV